MRSANRRETAAHYSAEIAATLESDGHRGRPVHGDQRGRPATGTVYGDSSPKLVDSGRGHRPADACAGRRRDGRLPLRGGRLAAVVPDAAAAPAATSARSAASRTSASTWSTRAAAGRRRRPKQQPLSALRPAAARVRRRRRRPPPSRSGPGPTPRTGGSGVRADQARHSRHPPCRTGASRPPMTTADGQVIWVWPEMSLRLSPRHRALGGRLGRGLASRDSRAGLEDRPLLRLRQQLLPCVLYPALYRLAYPQWNPDIDYHVNEFYLLGGRQVLHQQAPRHLGQGDPSIRTPWTRCATTCRSRVRSGDGRTSSSRRYDADRPATSWSDGWQGWLNDLGARVAGQYGGDRPRRRCLDS